MPADQDPIDDYRYDATRKNIPPAALASQGRVCEIPRQRYHYDPHLPPILRFDETGESDRLPELLQEATRRKLTPEEADILAGALRNHQPWLEWAGKREKSWFDVDTVALHIHERVSARAIMQVAARQDVQRSLWADPEQDYHEAVQFYRHDVDWANRLVLGDSLAVMNSLAKREDLAGKVQMIYVDPPYGINHRSNFQPFVRNRNVTDREADLTRESEMVKAYRDTWMLGIHTYLAYLRDRLTIARDLLSDSGSIFIQIGDENIHSVRYVMDDVFGKDNFIAEIKFKTTSNRTSEFVPTVFDSILFYSKDRISLKYHSLFLSKDFENVTEDSYSCVEEYPNLWRRLTRHEKDNPKLSESIGPLFGLSDLTSSHEYNREPFTWFNRPFGTKRRYWSTSHDRLSRLGQANRLCDANGTLRYKRFFRDTNAFALSNVWNDIGSGSRTEERTYAVQTNTKVIQRCMLMTTDPGDLVLDPTCGSGTTAYVAEQWGRRWITIDTSRVAVALARQRILTAKFDYYKTEDGSNTVGTDNFRYKTVPHITLGGIANNVALDPIFAKWEPILDEKLNGLNDALSLVDDELRTALLSKLEAKRRKRPRRDYPITEADERRWRLPKERWEHWEVPFDADPDYPDILKERLEAYCEVWRGKMDEVNACIAANADQEVLVDQPEVERGITRVSGPFTVEAVQPAEESLDPESPIGGAPDELDAFSDNGAFNADEPYNAESFRDTMIRLLRNDGVRFEGNHVAKFTRLEPLTDGTILHAEGEWDSDDPDNPRLVAVSLGPQYGPITAKQVEDSLWTASRSGYDTIVFAGHSFDGPAQAAIQADPNPRVRAHMTQISPDVAMTDLLKESRDSQLFTVSGLPRTKLERLESDEYTVEMEGVDIYDPVKNTIVSENANGVAAWFLDSDYDGRTFCTTQAFFPDSNAWDRLKRSLKSVVDADAFDAFGGTKSLPFPAGQHKRVAVKVIDPRGNEVMKIHSLEDSATW
ncbi:MAG: site-specific DNA-methyltransferase [Dehalococcoidia bacterium]|nr:site-specific DNA-methyltransferase [Dehalococcoidia bacterium]